MDIAASFGGRNTGIEFDQHQELGDGGFSIGSGGTVEEGYGYRRSYSPAKSELRGIFGGDGESRALHEASAGRYWRDGPAHGIANAGGQRVHSHPEGGISNNIRAAERFISLLPGVGAALQAAFPVVGAIALAGVFVKVGEEVYKFVRS